MFNRLKLAVASAVLVFSMTYLQSKPSQVNWLNGQGDNLLITVCDSIPPIQIDPNEHLYRAPAQKFDMNNKIEDTMNKFSSMNIRPHIYAKESIKNRTPWFGIKGRF